MNTTQNAETDTSGAEDKPVIETHGLCKTFNGTTALKSLNLRVPKNSIFGFLGPNDAGKTTTIKLLLGLSSPTEGEGKVFGKDISTKA
jgi:ABC-type multidrug transport system ATPase subunit